MLYIFSVSPSGTDTEMFRSGFDKTVNPTKFKEFYAKHSQVSYG